MPESTLFPLPGDCPDPDAIQELFDPGRLTQARQAKAWTKRALADALGSLPPPLGSTRPE